MKNKRLICLGGIFLGLFSIAKVIADEVQVNFKVVDDFGNPVQGAAVGIATFQHWLPGGDFGEDVYKDTNATTDTNGTATIKGTSQEPTIKFGIKPKDHYYYTSGGDYTFKSTENGKWQPWNPTIKLVLKPIINPIPMYAREVGGSMLGEKIPVTGKPVGFDLMIGDWVSPYGKGETPDFVFRFDHSVIRIATNSYKMANGQMRSWADEFYDNKLSIRFSNEGDGIQFMKAIPCGLKSPRLAPTEGYQPTLNKRAWAEEGKLSGSFIEHSDYDKNANYFFRVRTKKDDSGGITNALYGKIYGDFTENLGRGLIRFTYYLNPKPNSRNMEFNPQQNLFTNLPPFERVSAP